MRNKTIENWKEKNFEQCIKNINYTNKVPKKLFKRNGLYPIISQEEDFINGYWDDKNDLFAIEKPVVIFGDHTKKIKYIDFNFVIGADGVKIISVIDEILPKYMYYYLKQIKLRDLGYARHYKLLKEVIIRYPNYKEQERIVKILDKVFEDIEKAKKNAEQNLNNVKELYENIQKNIFNGNFPQKKLGDICCLYQGLAINAKTKHLLVEKSSLPLLRIKDLKENTVSQYVKEEDYPINALVKENDIIYTRTGSLGLVFSGKKGILHNNSFKVVPNDEIYREYLIEYLKNPNFKRKIISFAEKAAQPDITHSIFKQQTIPIPSKEIQKAIIGKLVSIREQTVKLEQIYTQKIKDLEELKQSILQKAFNGEL